MNSRINENIKSTVLDVYFLKAGGKQAVVFYAPSEDGVLRIRNMETIPDWINARQTLIDDGRTCKVILEMTALSATADRGHSFNLTLYNDFGNQVFTVTAYQYAVAGTSVNIGETFLLAGNRAKTYKIRFSTGGPVTLNSCSSSNFSMGTARFDSSGNIEVITKYLQSDLVAERVYYVLVNITAGEHTFDISIPVMQSTVRNRPVWEDGRNIILSKNTGGYYDCRISMYEDSLSREPVDIYEGRVYSLPGDELVYFNPNRIMENFVERGVDISVAGSIQEDRGYAKIADIHFGNMLIGTYSFFYDWSYGEQLNRNAGSTYLTYPITGDQPVDIRQTYVSSIGQFGTDMTYFSSVQWSDGSIDEYDHMVWNECVGTDMRAEGPFALDCVIKPSDYPGIKYLRYDTRYGSTNQIPVRMTCADYCLHYLNKYGGYDYILVNGKTDIDDQIKPHSFLKKPRTSKDFEETRYLIENRRKYTVNINWLSKDECSRMDQLLESPQVWLEDLSTSEMTPVVLQNQEMTFHRNKKVRNYKLIYLASETRRRK